MMKTIAIGMAIALIGLALLSQYNVGATYVRWHDIVTKGTTGTNDSWTISGNLTAGDIVTFVFLQGSTWSEGPFDVGDDGVSATLWVNVGITPIDPLGNTTTFTVEEHLKQPSGQGGGATQMVWYNCSVMKEGSIDTSVIGRDNKGRYQEIGGRIPWNGTYQADVVVYPPTKDAPSYLAFGHNITETTHPNTSLLPVGGAVIVSGGALLAYGIRGTMNHAPRKRSKIERR
jgi:hypothetical protein